MLRVERVNFDQSVKDLDEVRNVDCANTFSDTMIHLEELVDCLYVVTGEEQVWVGVSGSDYSLEVLLDVLKDRVDVVDLSLLVVLDTDHPAESFIYVEYLVKL